MTQNFDSRIKDAMFSLGYRVFPFEAFDNFGQLKVPDSVSFPSNVREGLTRIVTDPLWVDLYRTISPLQSSRRVFMAGIGFVNDRIQIALFKNTNTVAGADEAMNWADSYHDTVEETVHRYAGTSYLLDPNWRVILNQARGSLPPEQRDVEPATSIADFQVSNEDNPPSGESVAVVSFIPWLKFGLDLVFELVTKAMVRTSVFTTVVWYSPNFVDNTFASNWKPIHATLQKGWLSGHRSAHLIWNPVGTPVTWRGQSVAWRGPGLDMPHEPVQWCQALRPHANCLGRPIVESSDEQSAVLAV